jgi:hypothetical protein
MKIALEKGTPLELLKGSLVARLSTRARVKGYSWLGSVSPLRFY